ncbi:MAG: arginine--tRNA ligase [Alphaproteobacteria bacterium]
MALPAKHQPIYHYALHIIRAACAQLQAEAVLPADVNIDRVEAVPPKEAIHGDVATNAAMVLAKPAGIAPRLLAEKLVALLLENPDIQSAVIAGPGFINISLKTELWWQELRQIVQDGSDYARTNMGNGKKVNVEFVSANPTGPLHTAHARGAVVGDVLAALLEKTGHQVTREYYINDAGAQVQILAKSLYLRYREALGEEIGEIPAGFYPGEYLKPVGAAIAARDGKKWLTENEATWLPVFREFGVAQMMESVKKDLHSLNIHMDVFSSERALVEAGVVDECLQQLDSMGLLYTGVLEPPKGKKPDDWEERPQLLFRSSNFGDDMDRPLKKADGSYTYFANDIAYHMDKLRRGAEFLVDVVGADHAGWVARIKAAVAALSNKKAMLDVRLCALVNFLQDGQPVKMSKRQGSFVTLEDVLAEVGSDVLRFIMLTRRNDQSLDFDLVKVQEASRDNPVYYVHYAHARCCSVLRHAVEAFGDAALNVGAADLSRLDAAEELAVIKILASWPMVLEAAAISCEPHRLAYYLAEVAEAFHHLWTKGKDNTKLRFIGAEITETLPRLVLVKGVASILADGLNLMGVTPREELRA